MAINWNTIGKIEKEPEISYSQEGKPMCFLRVSTRRDWIKDENNPNENNDFALFGDFAVVMSESKIGDVIGLSGVMNRRKNKEDVWINDYRVKEIYLQDGTVVNETVNGT